MSKLRSQFLKSIAYTITPERTGNKKWIYATVFFQHADKIVFLDITHFVRRDGIEVPSRMIY